MQHSPILSPPVTTKEHADYVIYRSWSIAGHIHFTDSWFGKARLCRFAAHESSPIYSGFSKGLVWQGMSKPSVTIVQLITKADHPVLSAAILTYVMFDHNRSENESHRQGGQRHEYTQANSDGLLYYARLYRVAYFLHRGPWLVLVKIMFRNFIFFWFLILAVETHYVHVWSRNSFAF